MEVIPELGSKVKYSDSNRSCVAVVKDFYGEDICEEVHYPAEVLLEVDELPDWWIYPDTNKFLSFLENVELIE